MERVSYLCSSGVVKQQCVALVGGRSVHVGREVGGNVCVWGGGGKRMYNVCRGGKSQRRRSCEGGVRGMMCVDTLCVWINEQWREVLREVLYDEISDVDYTRQYK